MAKRDFPSIVFSKSIMVGDDKSDIIFAKALNMKSVLIEDIEYAEKTKVKADFVFESLFDFALSF